MKTLRTARASRRPKHERAIFESKWSPRPYNPRAETAERQLRNLLPFAMNKRLMTTYPFPWRQCGHLGAGCSPVHEAYSDTTLSHPLRKAGWQLSLASGTSLCCPHVPAQHAEVWGVRGAIRSPKEPPTCKSFDCLVPRLTKGALLSCQGCLTFSFCLCHEKAIGGGKLRNSPAFYKE